MSLYKQQGEKYGQIIPFLQSGEALYHRGLIAYQKKDFAKAIYFMEKAITLKENDAIFYCQLAVIYAEVGNYLRSNELLNQVINEMDAEMYECYFFLANNYAYLGMFEKAEEMAFYYIDHCPDGEFVQDCKALLRIVQYDFDELEDWSEEAIDEDVLIIRHDQAEVFLQQGEYELAILQYDKIINENPRQWSAYNHKAIALFRQGKTDEAIQLTLEVLTKDEGNLFSLCNLAYFYFHNEQIEDALEIVRQLQSVEPIAVEQRFKLAETFAFFEKYERAYEHLNKLRNIAIQIVDSNKYYECLAVCLYHLGYTKKALNYWKLLANYGNERAQRILERNDRHELTKERIQYEW